ncbi:MAG: DUF6513 domain-containing protein [Gemmataceae bacterium]
MTRPHVVFVTGKLAEPALRRVAAGVAQGQGIDVSVVVLPITVAALATTDWIARHLQLPAEARRVVLPGLCQGDLKPLMERFAAVAFERGPEDLRDLPEHFGALGRKPTTATTSRSSPRSTTPRPHPCRYCRASRVGYARTEPTSSTLAATRADRGAA